MVQRSMQERTVRAGEEELFKHRAREKGRIKILAWFDSYRLSSNAVWKTALPINESDTGPQSIAG